MKSKQHFNKTHLLTREEASKKIAFHAAGHATAIYLGNQQKGLEPVFFQILINLLSNDLHLGKHSKTYTAKVEGGCLIDVPSSLDQATQGFSKTQKHAYSRAFDRDIINLLAGFLAEAKYVALRDDEPISPRLVNIEALPNYGSLAELEKLNQYFECIAETDVQKETKIIALYNEAFRFVSERSNWLAITALAGYILTVDKNTIDFDEIIAAIAGSRAGLISMA